MPGNVIIMALNAIRDALGDKADLINEDVEDGMNGKHVKKIIKIFVYNIC